jgi:site-specific recombinase XerD
MGSCRPSAHGHAKLETTAGYTEITFEDLEKVVRAIE